MSNKTRILIIVGVAVLLVAGVLIALFVTGVFSPDAPATESSVGGDTSAAAPDVSEDPKDDSHEESEMSIDERWDSTKAEYDTSVFTGYDLKTEFGAEDTTIVCSGKEATVTGEGAAFAAGTISIYKKGTYVLSGDFKGRILVEVDKEEKVHLVLNGFSISCATYSPLLCTSADKLCITIADGTENRIEDTGSGYKDNQDVSEEAEGRSAGALHAKCDLSINGNGKLTVSTTYRHGIFSKKDLKIASGDITVDAASSGIKGKKSLTIGGGNIRVKSGGDALKVSDEETSGKGYFLMSDGVVITEAGGDGVDIPQSVQIKGGSLYAKSVDNCITCKGDVRISGAKTKLNLSSTTVGRGINAEKDILIDDGVISVVKAETGLKSGTAVRVRGGSVSVNTNNDGFKAANLIAVSNGSIYVNASGDGFDCDGNIEITGGSTVINGPTIEDDGALDCGDSAEIIVNGGFLLAYGSKQDAKYPADTSKQFSIGLTGDFKQDTVYSLRAKAGNTICTFKVLEPCTSICISSSVMVDKMEYTLYEGAECEAESSNGLFESGSSSKGGTGVVSITTNGVSTVMSASAE